MAAYDINTSFVANCDATLINMNNTITRKIMTDTIGIINDELVAIESAQSTYTLQLTSLQAQKKFANLSNDFRTDIFMLWIDAIWTEFASVVALGNSYVKLGSAAISKRMFDWMPDILVKQVMHALIDLIDTELDAIEASDADS